MQTTEPKGPHARRICHALCVLIFLSTGTLAAQTRHTIGPATATLREEFTSLSSIRELADGRILLTDAREIRLVLADFAKNTVTQLGRIGDGPGEYRRANRLFPLGNDSTLMVQLRLPWIVIDPKGSLSSLPTSHPMLEYFRLEGLDGTDAMGKMLTEREPPRRAGQLRISSHLLLVSRATLRADTIARVDKGPVPRRMTVEEVERNGDWLDAYPAYDRSLLAPDGWVVVARFSPYRVDWRSPDGRWTNGPPINERPIQVTAREKEAFFSARSGGQSTRPSTLAPGMGVRTGDSPPAAPLNWAWPETIPPFTGRSIVLTTPAGQLVVERTPTADQRTPVYDVFNRQGVREYQITLPARRKILGFGNGVVYIVTTDDVDIQRLSRHRWPVLTR